MPTLPRLYASQSFELQEKYTFSDGVCGSRDCPLRFIHS